MMWATRQDSLCFDFSEGTLAFGIVPVRHGARRSMSALRRRERPSVTGPEALVLNDLIGLFASY